MKAMVLPEPGPIDTRPLQLVDLPVPEPGRVTDPGTKSRSGPDDPTIWYASAVPSFHAYWVCGRFTAR